MNALEMLRAMLLIRRFEQALLQRPDHGFQLLSSGEEAVAVGLCATLQAQDMLLSSGRSIGPALARGVQPGRVMAELLGKIGGACRGRGGRGHLADPDVGFFGAHAVVGGNLSIATGVALAAQQLRQDMVVACIFGDGACGGGALHETLNIAALWKLPLLLVCDNNGYSVSTPRTQALAPRQLSDLARPFGVPGCTVDGMDVLAVRDAARHAAERARAGHGPSFLECLSERFESHSTATRDTRTEIHLATLRARCPIQRHAARLIAEGQLQAAAWRDLQDDVERQVQSAIRFAEASPLPEPGEVLHDVI